MKNKYLLIFLLTAIPLVVNGQIINFDDPNFKSVLLTANPTNTIAQNSLFQYIEIDTNGNNEIEVTESEQVYRLSIPSHSNISSLIGIEFFSNLSLFYCNYNQLIELDVSMLSNLKSLHVIDNQLEILEFNPQLETLLCANNNLEFLDFSEAEMLISLNCGSNSLSELDLSNSQNLQNLNCSNNQLTSLSIQSLPLQNVQCDNNLLTNLDLSQVGINSSNTPLIIGCSNNLLTNIDTTVTENSKVNLSCGNNPNLVSLNLKNGETFFDNPPHLPPLSAVYFNNSNYNLELICADEFNFDYLQAKLDANGILDCELTSECRLGITESNKDNFTLYPNPTNDVLIIKSPSQYKSLIVYNIMGQIIHKTSFESNIPIRIDFLSSGNYVAKIISDNDFQLFKFIKE